MLPRHREYPLGAHSGSMNLGLTIIRAEQARDERMLLQRASGIPDEIKGNHFGRNPPRMRTIWLKLSTVSSCDGSHLPMTQQESLTMSLHVAL